MIKINILVVPTPGPTKLAKPKASFPIHYGLLRAAQKAPKKIKGHVYKSN